jgi:uncharacterized protein (TIGR02118 family)
VYKIIWLAKFRHDRPREEVLRAWRGHHAELALATPGLVRYVQNHWVAGLDVDSGQPSDAPVWDGHAELWFADRPAYDAAMASSEWRRVVEDGPNLFERTLVGAALEETVICWNRSTEGGDPT